MDINVRYTGLSTVPSDYDSGDGELAAVVNMVPEDGGLKPMQPPKDMGITLDAGQMLIFIHKTGSFTHYIITEKTEDSETPYKLSWIGGDESGDINAFTGTVQQVTALGNTLIISTSYGLFYARWKDDKYIFLGSKPEAIKVDYVIRTALYSSNMLESTEGENASFQDYFGKDQFKNLIESENPDATGFILKDKKAPFANLVFSLLNRMTKKVAENGAFSHPFFMRLAYRMYDGSHIMYTAPHLIVPTSTGKPLLFLRREGSDETVHAMFVMPNTTVSFNIRVSDDAELWSDIITNIDVFATPQIVTYTTDDEGIESVGKISEEELSTFTVSTIQQKSYRPTLLDAMDETYANIYTIGGKDAQIIDWNDIWGSGATFAFIDTMNYPDNCKLMATWMKDGPFLVEFPQITPQEAISMGLPVSQSFKIYEIDKQKVVDILNAKYPNAGPGPQGGNFTMDTIIYVRILKSGPPRQSYMRYVKGKEALDTTQCLSIKLKRADGENSLMRQVTSASNFYLIYDKIKYDELIKNKNSYGQSFVTPQYAKSDLLNISVKQTVPDDYRSGDTLIPGYAFAYNNRINLALDALIPFGGDDFRNVFDYPYDDFSWAVAIPKDQAIHVTDCYVEINENGTRYFTHVEAPKPEANWHSSFLLQFTTWYFYPNINAHYVWYKTYTNEYDEQLNITKVTHKLLRIPLTPHNFLNGAYAFNNMLSLDGIAETMATIEVDAAGKTDEELSDLNKEARSKFDDHLKSDATSIPVQNKIYTSEVNNPFLFPVSGINTVGTGRIIGISSAVKALSQGQFGQFPLYAFTTDGVWALQVSDTGTYSARQPVTRDVCINAASITQIDTAVLFATSRGIMLIEGSETVCMTDVLSGEDTLRLNALPHIGQIARLSDFDEKDFVTEDFMAFIEKCRMIYDYRHQRIIVYKPMEESAPLPTPPQKDGQATTSYAYVYSLKSKQWGMLKENIAYGVRSYPDALAVLRTGAKDSLVNFSEEAPDAEKNYRGIVITRPLKLGMPDVLKTVNTVVQRGYFRRGHVRCALYASRDMYNWFMVWSSTDHYLRGFSGTPYKYYRMVLLCDLDDDENLAGCTVRFVPKMMNRLR